jgi:hypothetical protein
MFFAKTIGGKIGDFDTISAEFFFVFTKIAIFCRKLAKIGDNNIGPR